MAAFGDRLGKTVDVEGLGLAGEGPGVEGGNIGLGMFSEAERRFAVPFFAEFLRLVATDVLGHVGEVSAEESVVLVHHEIFVGKFIIKKISFTLLKRR